MSTQLSMAELAYQLSQLEIRVRAVEDGLTATNQLAKRIEKMFLESERSAQLDRKDAANDRREAALESKRIAKNQAGAEKHQAAIEKKLDALLTMLQPKAVL